MMTINYDYDDFGDDDVDYFFLRFFFYSYLITIF